MKDWLLWVVPRRSIVAYWYPDENDRFYLHSIEKSILWLGIKWSKTFSEPTEQEKIEELLALGVSE